MPDKEEEDRIFIRDGWRHYRRRYSLTEVRWGVVTFLVILGLLGWVAWRGAHPDPSRFADPTALMQAPVTAIDRGPLPKDLAGTGWREDKIAQFDPDNLYIKIDGRADYFKSFGFKRLYGLLLVSDQDPAVTVDVEMYDMGTPANALGAYGGERAPTAHPTVTEAGLHHIDRNALFLARGPYYIRVIGSDESPAITSKIAALADQIGNAVKGTPLPWAFGLFVGQLGLDPGQVAYFAENAFSFAFGRDVWTGRPGGKDDDREWFVAAQTDAKAAQSLAEQFHAGFLQLGEADRKVGGIPLVKDQFLGQFAGVGSRDRFLFGIHGAATADLAAQDLARLKAALAEMPTSVKDRARPADPATNKGGTGEP